MKMSNRSLLSLVRSLSSQSFSQAAPSFRLSLHIFMFLVLVLFHDALFDDIVDYQVEYDEYFPPLQLIQDGCSYITSRSDQGQQLYIVSEYSLAAIVLWGRTLPQCSQKAAAQAIMDGIIPWLGRASLGTLIPADVNDARKLQN